MGNRIAQRCHYLNQENVPLSVAICETVAAYDRSRPADEGSPVHDYLDVEAVDSLFSEPIVEEESVSLTLRLNLPETCVDVHTEHDAHADEPVRILVTEADD